VIGREAVTAGGRIKGTFWRAEGVAGEKRKLKRKIKTDRPEKDRKPRGEFGVIAGWVL